MTKPNDDGGENEDTGEESYEIVELALGGDSEHLINNTLSEEQELVLREAYDKELYCLISIRDVMTGLMDDYCGYIIKICDYGLVFLQVDKNEKDEMVVTKIPISYGQIGQISVAFVMYEALQKDITNYFNTSTVVNDIINGSNKVTMGLKDKFNYEIKR